MMKQFIKTFLIFVFTIIFSIQIAYSNDFRFVQITDLHYRNDAISEENLDKMIKNINQTKNVEFVVFTGDNTNDSKKEDYIKFLTQANTLNIPYYVIVGNHDVFKMGGFSKQDFVKVVREYNKNQKARKTNFVFKYSDFIFVAVDGVREVIPSPGGYYRDDTLAWVDKMLKKYKNKNVIILQHFPMKLRHTERDAYKNDRYEAILAKHHNVKGIFAGHFHANEEYIKDGIFYSITGRASGGDAGYKVVDIVQEEDPQTHKKGLNFYTQFVFVKDL